MCELVEIDQSITYSVGILMILFVWLFIHFEQ